MCFIGPEAHKVLGSGEEPEWRRSWLVSLSSLATGLGTVGLGNHYATIGILPLR